MTADEGVLSRRFRHVSQPPTSSTPTSSIPTCSIPASAPTAFAPEPKPPLAPGLPALATALLRSPADVVKALKTRTSLFGGLALITFATMALTGVVMAAFSGGLQLLWVPLKVSFGLLFCGVICLPSLFIFTSLAGGRQSFRETAGALMMGLALIGVLLVGFAPVTWLFSQATSAVAFMGALHVIFFLVSAWFGIGLIRRALAVGGQAPRGSGLWACLFVLVALQMSTTLRPLIGPDEGLLFHEKQFFLVHWLTGG